MTDLEWISNKLIEPAEHSRYYRNQDKLVCTGFGDVPKDITSYSYADIQKHRESSQAA